MFRPSSLLLSFLLFFVSVSGPLLADESIDAAPGASDRVREAIYEFAHAKLLADEGDFQGALAAFRRAIELDSSDPYALLEVARFHNYLAQISRSRQQQTEYLDDGLLYIDRARQLAPDDPDVLLLFAETHLRLSNERPSSLPLAQGAFETLRETQPGDLQVLTSLAQIYLWNQEPAAAADVLREAVRYSPRNRMIHTMLVDALRASGTPMEAEESLEALTRLEPDNLEARLQLAEIRSERGDHDGAVEVLAPALEIEPGPGDTIGEERLRQVLAREYHLAGRHAEALEQVDAALEIEPAPGTFGAPGALTASGPNLGLLRLRAAVLSAMARYEEAAQAFAPVVEATADPARRAQDTQLLARLHERRGDADLAIDVLRREIARLDQDAPLGAEIELRIALAGVEQRSGRLDRAADVLREGFVALDAAPPGRELIFTAQALADVLVGEDRLDEALTVLDDAATRLESASASASVEAAEGEAGSAASDLADMAEALRLRRAIVAADAEAWDRVDSLADSLAASEDPGVRLAARQLEAQVLAHRGEVDAALELLAPEDTTSEEPASEDAAPEEPESAGPDRFLAARVDLLFEHGREAEARAAIDRLAQSSESENLLVAAQLLQRQELHAEAVPLYERVLTDEAENLNVLFALGAAYERSGRRAEAASLFERLLDLRPAHAPTLNYLAYMWIEKAENLDRALGMVKEAVATEPDNGAYVDSLGWAYYQLGRYEEAREHLEWAARLEPEDPAVFEHLGDVYLALEEPDRARGAYARALAQIEARAEVATDAEQAERVREKLDTLDDTLDNNLDDTSDDLSKEAGARAGASR